MKKRILFVLLSILFLFPNKIMAASGVSVNASSNRVYVGETVTITVTVSSDTGIGGLEYNVYYDDGKLDYIDGDSTFPQGVAEPYYKGPNSVPTKWIFKAKEAGTVTFSTSGIEGTSIDEKTSLSFEAVSTTIEIVNPTKPSSGGSNGGGNSGHTDYKYSDDNNLSSLIIEGFDIDFDSSITEYSVTVPNDTKKVKLGATANDNNASVSGIGDYDVKEGNNEIKIVVTAENGDTKTYKVNVVVKELSPIEVTVDDKTYSVVRKSDKLPKVNATYKAGTILIKGESVPCYHSEITDIYLIGLMNDKGKVELFNYDSKNDKFSVYTEINVSGLYISLIDNDDVPLGYSKGLVKIGDKEYSGYLKDGAYSLLYGINLETGEKNFYSYDSSEGTLQKYASSNGVNSKYYSYIIIGLIGLCAFEFIMLIISVVSKNKQLKKYLHNKLDVKSEYEKSLEDQSDDSDSLEEENSIEDSSEEETFDVEEQDDIESNEESETDDDDVQSENSDVSFDTEEIEEGLGHTALISKSVTNVYNNTKNRKESIKERKSLRKKKKNKKDDDDMFKF